MTAISNYLENAMASHLLRGVAITAPTIYVSAHTADPSDTGASELAGGGYARVAVSAWDIAASRATQNTNAILFPVMQAGVGTVSYFGVWDALSSGNFLFGTTVAINPTIATSRGSAIQILAGGLDISLSGEISTYAANKMLDLLFRGTAFTPPTPFASLHTATPGLTGASECSGNAYARVAVSTWNSPSGGATANTNLFAFPTPTPSGYGTVTHAGLWDAATSGNFLFGKSLTDSYATGTEYKPTFDAGSFDVVIA